MLRMTPNGLYCEAGDFYIDPSRRVDRAVITHAHSDHARRGMGSYLAHHHCVPLLYARLGKNISAHGLAYGEHIDINGVRVSLHPSGHIFGSAQVRLEHRGEVWVVTGDYKREADPVAEPFEVVPCHTFITETTFALPVYRWPDASAVAADINAWWRSNAANGCLSVIRAYSLGKTQRILAQLDPSIGPILLSDACFDMTLTIAQTHNNPTLFPPHSQLSPQPSTLSTLPSTLILTSSALSLDQPHYVADASGWLAVSRHRRTGIQPFIVSDHVDWPSLVQTVRDTGCEQVLCMHGFTDPFVRWCREQGLHAFSLEGGEGRTQSFYPELTTQRAIKMRTQACQAAYIPEWLFDVSYGHVKELKETFDLVSGATCQVPSATFRVPSDDSLLATRCLTTVLYHIHRLPGSRSIEMFTMGIRLGEEIVPLVHVAPDVERALMLEVLGFAEKNTIVQVGPVRTLAPYYIFEVEVAGITVAPRRKSGVRVTMARISRLMREATLEHVATVDDVRALVEEKPGT